MELMEVSMEAAYMEIVEAFTADSEAPVEASAKDSMEASVKISSGSFHRRLH